MNENMTKAQRRDATREKARTLREQGRRRAQRRRAAVVGGAAAVVLALVVGIGVAVQAARSDVDDDAAQPTSVTEAGGVLIGPADAPVAVRLYLDYQCPACKAFEEANAQYRQSLVDQGTASLEYVPVSILGRFSTTRYATRAANAAFCAIDADSETFHTVNAALFAAQPPGNTEGLTDGELANLVIGAGAPASVRSCIADGRFEDHVATVTDAASQAGLQGTPTITVNGQPVQTPTPDALKAAVAEVLTP